MMTIPERLRVCADAVQRANEAPSIRVRAQMLVEARSELYSILADMRSQLTQMTMGVPRPTPKQRRPAWFDLVPDPALLRYWSEVDGITITLARTLAKLGIQDLLQLAGHSEAQLLRTPYIGRDSVRRIKRALENAGLRLQGTGTFPLEPEPSVQLGFLKQSAPGGPG